MLEGRKVTSLQTQLQSPANTSPTNMTFPAPVLQREKRKPQSCWERHRTEAQLSSLSFSSMGLVAGRKWVPLTKWGKHNTTQSSLSYWMGLLRALKKQTMPNSSRKLILIPPGSIDSHCRELRGNSEIHRLLQSPFITAHNDAQAVPEAIQLDFSSASLVLHISSWELWSCTCVSENVAYQNSCSSRGWKKRWNDCACSSFPPSCSSQFLFFRISRSQNINSGIPSECFSALHCA